MFFRMLKKDLKDSPGLNIFIFFSMIVCSILVVTGVILLYASIFGFNNSFKLSNSTDAFIVTAKSVSNGEQKHKVTEEWLQNRSEVESFNCMELIPVSANNLRVNFEILSDKIGLATLPSYLSKMPAKTNLVYDMNDSPFVVTNGTVAIDQNNHTYYNINIGDKITLTTQLGNTYTFTVAHIFKDSSIYMYHRYIFSDDDYAVLCSESPVIYNNYEIKTTDFANYEVAQAIFSPYQEAQKLGKVEKLVTYYNHVNFEGSKLMTSIVAILCAGVAVFLILIVIMALRFTLTSIIKREERRLGTLRAIGVDSFSFKWLFTAKFIFFAIVSGVVGIFAGIPITNVLMDSVMTNIIKPTAAVEITLGVISACVTVALIIFFIFKSMKKMDKVSIINAIHGEARSERFNKIPGLELAGCKKMKLPLYLALTDILGRFKRYIFLAFSYVFGFAIILLVFQLKTTVLSWEFLYKTQLMGKFDFYIELPDEEQKIYALKTDGTLRGINEKLNEELKENDIPAFIDTATFSEGSILLNGKEFIAGFVSGLSDVSKLNYKKGGTAPVYKNEVAINYIFAKKNGISIGDVVCVKYKKADENKLNYTEVTEDFVITAFTDVCSNGVILIMSTRMEDLYPLQTTSSQQTQGRIISCEIFAPEEEKSMYLEKIRELYGKENVKSEDEYFTDIWGGSNEGIFNILRNFITVLVLIVMILNTALYEQIFIDEEVSDIAMLKTVGFAKRDIKLWQYLRIIILIVAGFLLGTVVTATVGNALLESAIHVLMYASGFDLIATPLVEYVAIPVILIIILSSVLLISFKNINSIFVWRIKDE